MPIKVAIIEDHCISLIGLNYVCEGHPDLLMLGGYKTAEAALEALPGLDPDVLVVDVDLPGMNGLEFIKIIRQRCKDVQCLVFTYLNDRKTMEYAKKVGAARYLPKDKTNDEQLINSILEVAEEKNQQQDWITKLISESVPDRSVLASRFLLTEKEQEVISFLAAGLAYKQIAAEMTISIETVRKHCSNIYEKLDVTNRTEAINKVFPRNGI